MVGIEGDLLESGKYQLDPTTQRIVRLQPIIEHTASRLNSSSSSMKSCIRSPGVMYGLFRNTSIEEAGAKSGSALGSRFLLYQLPAYSAY